MRRKLPSMRALESFEAVARYGNVTRAAEELGRTQSAVSRQIANLESFVRRKLFTRQRKQLILNKTGLIFCKQISPILDALEAEMTKLISLGKETRSLRLGVSSTFGSRWLMPRLAGFAKAGGSTELCLAGLGRPNLQEQQIDAWIECSVSRPEGLMSQHLLDEEIVAVVSPELYAVDSGQFFDQLRLPSDSDTWKYWVAERGIPPLSQNTQPFEDYSLLIEAAILGFGVAVVPVIYLYQELATGRLITPFGDPIRSGRSYWLTYPESSPEGHRVSKLSNWLTAASDRQTAVSQAPQVSDILSPDTGGQGCEKRIKSAKLVT